jgi:hypothetical protein
MKTYVDVQVEKARQEALAADEALNAATKRKPRQAKKAKTEPSPAPEEQKQKQDEKTQVQEKKNQTEKKKKNEKKQHKEKKKQNEKKDGFRYIDPSELTLHEPKTPFPPPLLAKNRADHEKCRMLGEECVGAHCAYCGKGSCRAQVRRALYFH